LSLDAGSYNGIITARTVSLIEQKAYTYMNHMYCIKRPSNKVAMHEMFDMITGSGTGAIIASSLVVPNDDPATKDTQQNKYFAETSVKYFYDHMKDMYHQRKPSDFMKFVIFAAINIGFLY